MPHAERGGAVGGLLEVHAVDDGAGAVRLDHLDRALGHGLLGLAGRGSDVVGGDDLGVAGQRGVDRPGGGRGLVGEHVDAGSHVGRVERGDQGLLVDDLASGGVDEHGVGLHGGQECGVDHCGGVVAAGDVQRHDV